MKKFRCPKCKTVFVGKLEHCPSCGAELHYLDEEVKKEIAVPQPSFHFDDEDVLTKGIEVQEEEIKSEKGTQEVTVRKEDLNIKTDAFGKPLSYFDGTTIQKFLWRLLGLLITICTAFIAYPWAMCLVYNWETKHKVIDGKRLYFDGKGIQLFGRYLLWLLLSILTLGIFLIFLANRVEKWKTMHTHFVKVIE